MVVSLKRLCGTFIKWSLGSHGYCALGSYRGPFDPFEMPTIDSRNESIVATNSFSIDRVDLNRSWRTLLETEAGSFMLSPDRVSTWATTFDRVCSCLST